MNKHTVFVAGKRFILLSEDKEEYVQKLASEVSKTINEIAETNPKLESRSCAILCALDYADDKYKEIERNKSLNQKAKTVIENADKHAKEIKDLKEKINYKNDTIAKLQAQVSELEKKLKKATENKPQEKTQPKPESKPTQEKIEPKPAQKPVEKKPEPKAENKPTEEKPVQEEQQENPQPQKKKKHQHPHENPYKAQAVEKKTEEKQSKGYTPLRQISLFENE